MRPVLYVQVRPDRFIVRKVGGGQAVDRAAPQPFSHPRALLASFTNAESFLRSLVAELAGGFFAIKPQIVLHPLERVEGGLTEIEERAFEELGRGAGASRVKLWTGEALTDAQVLEKLKE
jgi:rod shape-determining protein MreB and related proteins